MEMMQNSQGTLGNHIFLSCTKGSSFVSLAVFFQEVALAQVKRKSPCSACFLLLAGLHYLQNPRLQGNQQEQNRKDIQVRGKKVIG